MPMEKTLATLLVAETEARGIVEEAEKEAREIREKTQKESQAIIDEAKKKGEQDFQQTLEKARADVQAEKNEILRSAEDEAQHLEELFQRNREKTIKYITKMVTSLESGQ